MGQLGLVEREAGRGAGPRRLPHAGAGTGQRRDERAAATLCSEEKNQQKALAMEKTQAGGVLAAGSAKSEAKRS